ncbi:MAG TPA: hypothetical protein VGX48_22075 [Pyrinomonadaceae bacterium]|jgi:hypothetical protein|nr:hypothetical protein [Pyrinomonadaceae bacterium]
MSKLSSLAQLAIDAAGGLDRWRRFETVSARLSAGGVLWPLKHQQGVLDDVRVRVGLRKEWASHRPFGEPDLHTSFQPHRVAIENAEGQHVEELPRPRDSFRRHSLETPWTRPQLAYFAGYAMWTYLNTPFLFAWDGVETEEVEPWREGGETWRRLKVTFPPDLATHSAVQTFYFDAEGLLKRHDYEVEVSGGTPAAHYVYQHEEFSGILVPVRRRVLGRAPDGTPVPEPLIVSVDLSEVEFS